MIDKLLRDLREISQPSPSLDCDAHEVLTGELNECKGSMRETQRALGCILREHGGELKWFDVPKYTSDVEAVMLHAPVLHAFKLTWTPPEAIVRIRALLGKDDPVCAGSWAVTLSPMRAPDASAGFGCHDLLGTAALIAILEHRLAPPARKPLTVAEGEAKKLFECAVCGETRSMGDVELARAKEAYKANHGRELPSPETLGMLCDGCAKGFERMGVKL